MLSQLRIIVPRSRAAIAILATGSASPSNKLRPLLGMASARRHGFFESFGFGAGYKFTEDMLKKLSKFQDDFADGTEDNDIKFKLKFKTDHSSGDQDQHKTVIWNPKKKNLQGIFESLDLSIESFDMFFFLSGEEVTITGEDDVELLISETLENGQKFATIIVRLKQPTIFEQMNEKRKGIMEKAIKYAKYCISGEGQVKAAHVDHAKDALLKNAPALAKMEAKKSVLSQEGFDADTFVTHVDAIAVKLNMSDAEKGVLMLAPDLDTQASLEMKTKYEGTNTLYKQVTSWRTIRSPGNNEGKQRIHFVYGDFVLKCEAPEGGLDLETTLKLEDYVDLRAKHEWANQFSVNAEHAPLLDKSII